MENKKKLTSKGTRKTVFGIKLPPIEPCDDGDIIKTRIDVDPGYYSMIDGRPIRPNTSIQAYKQNIKAVAINRTLYGFMTDEILRIDKEIKSETKIYENTLKNFGEYQRSFDKFLTDDNDKTIAIMTKSDNLTKDLANLTEDQKQVNYEMASLKSKLQYIDETLTILLSLENFLHKASPILWQNEHNIKLNVKHSEIITMSNDIFQPLNVAAIKEKLDSLPQPRLFFKKPEQLLNIFDALEQQNLNYLLLTGELNIQKNKFIKSVDALKHLLNEELEIIQQEIDKTDTLITWNENREKELREMFMKILDQKIKYLLSSEMVLQIHNYVEYAYELLITENDTNLSTYEMTMALENEYNNIMLQLSAFDLDHLRKIEKKTYENEAKAFVQAKVANKLLKDVDKLNKRLKSSFEPSRRKTFF